MLASELIKKLVKLIELYGDRVVYDPASGELDFSINLTDD